MAVVKVKTFLATNEHRPLTQDELDVLAGQVDTFLAGIAAVNVLDINGIYATSAGRYDGRGATFTYTVVYLE
jgi:hypothetical protein